MCICIWSFNGFWLFKVLKLKPFSKNKRGKRWSSSDMLMLFLTKVSFLVYPKSIDFLSYFLTLPLLFSHRRPQPTPLLFLHHHSRHCFPIDTRITTKPSFVKPLDLEIGHSSHPYCYLCREQRNRPQHCWTSLLKPLHHRL